MKCKIRKVIDGRRKLFLNSCKSLSSSHELHSCVKTHFDAEGGRSSGRISNRVEVS